MVFLMKKIKEIMIYIFLYVIYICVIYMEVKENICIVKKIFYYL